MTFDSHLLTASLMLLGQATLLLSSAVVVLCRDYDLWHRPVRTVSESVKAVTIIPPVHGDCPAV